MEDKPVEKEESGKSEPPKQVTDVQNARLVRDTLGLNDQLPPRFVRPPEAVTSPPLCPHSLFCSFAQISSSSREKGGPEKRVNWASFEKLSSHAYPENPVVLAWSFLSLKKGPPNVNVP